MNSTVTSLVSAFSAASRKAYEALHESVRFAPARAFLGIIAACAFLVFAVLAPGDNYERLLSGQLGVLAPWRHWPSLIAAVVLWRLIARWIDPPLNRPRLDP
jgi:hypothetical protein